MIIEKRKFYERYPYSKTLSKEELYTLIQNYQKNHDQKSKEMIILSNTKISVIFNEKILPKIKSL